MNQETEVNFSDAYREMALDEQRELEALAWIEGLVQDSCAELP